jgi:hypothetical protein
MLASRDPVMIAGKRPFVRIFGDVRSFECLNCEYMFLAKHPFQSDPSNRGTDFLRMIWMQASSARSRCWRTEYRPIFAIG